MSITTLEEYTCRTWPALETVPYDGWLMRFADGCTNRANAVYPLYPSSYDLDRKIAHVEQEYSARGLRPTFKMTDAVLPPALDSVLASAGYEVIENSYVMSMPLTSDVNVSAPEGVSVSLAETFDIAWLDTYLEIQPSRASQRDAYVALLSSNTGKRIYASIIADGRIAAVGLSSRSRDHAGIYNMATHPDYRGQGYAEAIVRSLQNDAYQRGARIAFLSVSAANETAQRVYRRCGFAQSYRYCYRVKSSS
jgi:ribosomal protein S18 acetylase RimI-like enzyme